MKYVYHFVPHDMVGTVLYPLNVLEQTQPEVFKRQSKKYEGREPVKENDIPGLGKWNDVIHLSPIDPAETRKALRDAGSSISSIWRVYRIDADSLDVSRLVIHIEPEVFGSKEVINLPFTEDNYAQHCHLPARTKAYYKQCVDDGRQVLIYGFAPHVLYSGTIDVSKAEVKEYTN